MHVTNTSVDNNDTPVIYHPFSTYIAYVNVS